MKIIPFNRRHYGNCPGCGVFDNGTHYGHRYTLRECKHTYHASANCPDPKYQARLLAVTAKFHKALRKDLGVI